MVKEKLATPKGNEVKKTPGGDPVVATVKLATPVEWDDKTWTEIELSRPKGKHLKGMPASPAFDDILKIAIRISGWNNKVFELMDGYDCIQIAEKVSSFLESGPGTGRRR